MDEDKPPTIYKTWEDGFVVRSMTDDDAKVAQQWYSELYATSCDLQVALRSNLYEGGFYVGEIKGEVVASVIRIKVADGIYYGSYYYVKEEHRRKGYGRRIRDDVARLHVGENILAIDAVDNLLEMNKRHAYTEAFGVSAFAGKVPAKWNCQNLPSTKELTADDLDELIQYDNKCFIKPNSAQRRALMANWINIPRSACVAAMNTEGTLIGYGCRRPTLEGDNFLVGPLYADNYDAAYAIIHKLCCGFPGSMIQFDVCKNHREALQLTERLGLKEDVKMIRMYLNGSPGDLCPKVYALTSTDVCGF